MKKPKEPQRDELEQFEAYGEYSYAYRHAAEQRKLHQKNGRTEEGEPEYDLADGAEAEADKAVPEEELISPEERAKRRSRAITGRLIFVLAVAVIAIIVLQGTVFRLRTVYVIGNVKKSAQEVAAASGLVKGLNIFSISPDEVQENLSSDHTIVFLGLQKEYPSTIYLYISEREPVASTQWLGLQYTLDAEGVVLDENSSLELPANMPNVTGLQVTNVHTGQKLEVRNREQILAYYDIMSELGLQYYRDQIREINLSDTDNLYLLTATGISVRLGTRQYMRAKIGALRTDIAYLQQLGKTSGVLDVSIPEDAKYRPES
ncbi:MAG TPA: FtsQ-type POTRA domain-containing protein [Candidatus Limiplasma sp.]|nr:FtsQ-type POTRA domain-containing protein [Candidatus Limiplasma sp.]HPS81933.1 FtsQ-type POTRA domain-containing protein [Candidatus Limiplasma sp.]